MGKIQTEVDRYFSDLSLEVTCQLFNDCCHKWKKLFPNRSRLDISEECREGFLQKVDHCNEVFQNRVLKSFLSELREENHKRFLNREVLSVNLSTHGVSSIRV